MFGLTAHPDFEEAARGRRNRAGSTILVWSGEAAHNARFPNLAGSHSLQSRWGRAEITIPPSS